MTLLTKSALVSGTILMAGGALLLPPPPASPELIGASLAPVSFFFGGAFLFSGLFSQKHPVHGEGATLILSMMGLLYSAYLLLKISLSGTQQLVFGGLCALSFVLFLQAWKVWKQKRREANLRHLENLDHSEDA